MPRKCAIEKCKHKWRVTCTCCNKNFCDKHIKEHEESNNSKLNPIIDELNKLDERLNSPDVEVLDNGCQQKLDQWRDDCLKKINQLYEQKCQELKQRGLIAIDEKRKKVTEIRSKITDNLHQKDVDQHQSDLNLTNLRQIQQEIQTIGNMCFHIDIRPLVIDDSLIYIDESNSVECNLNNLSAPFRTIDCSSEWGPAVVSNNRLLLIDSHPKLLLVNQQFEIICETNWKFDFIRDMCWSSALNGFIAITRNREIYLIREKNLSTELIQVVDEQDWSSCSCSDTSLYLTTRREGTNVFEFDLSSSFNLIKRWKPPQSCKPNETIIKTAFKNMTLALIISHSKSNLVHFELRSSISFDRLWSVPLSIVHAIGQPLIRCSALKCNEWLVIDNNASQLIQIQKDGQIKGSFPYSLSPWNMVMFGSSILVVRTKHNVSFHRI